MEMTYISFLYLFLLKLKFVRIQYNKFIFLVI